MKKLLCLFMMLVFGGPVLASPVDWSEFCPSQYLNAGKMEIIKPNALSQFLLGASLVGIPVASYRLSNYNNAVLNNYWSDRRKQFENEVNLCSSGQQNDNKVMCYINIRQIELSKNTQLQNVQIAQQNLQIQRLQMVQQMNTNNSLNSINSNLNGIRYGY